MKLFKMIKLTIWMLLVFCSSVKGQSFQTDSIFYGIEDGVKAVRQFEILDSTMTREFGGDITYFKRVSEIEKVKVGTYIFNKWEAYDETHNRKCKVYFKEGFSIVLDYPWLRAVEYSIK